MASRKNTARQDRIILLIVAAVLAYLYARHAHAIPVLLLGAGVGLVTGLLTGARYGRIRRQRTVTRALRKETSVPRSPKIASKIFSPECLYDDCGSCSGISCDHNCGHPGNRGRVKTTPLDDEIPPF